MTTFVTRFLNSLNKAKERPLATSIALNVVFFLLFLSMGEWHFGSLDDFFMSSVLVGAYGGQYDVHTYFVNAAYGYVLKPLYMLFPDVGWYALGQVFETFAAFVAITYCILISLSGLWAWAVCLSILCCVLPGFWPDFAFTQCAAVLSAAGILLACTSLLQNKRKFMVVAVLFLTAGFVMRKDMFLLGLPTIVLALSFCWMKIRIFYKQHFLILLTGFAVIGGLYFFNASLYKTDGYDYYAAYQGPRAFFGDGGFYDSEAAYDELKERGLCGADLRVLRAWYFYDKEAFSLDSLQRKIEVVSRSNYDINYAKLPMAALLVVSRAFLGTNAWCWMALCLALVLRGLSFRKYLPWASLGLVMLSYTYMLIVNRIAGHVELGVWIYAIVFVLPFVDECGLVKTKVMEYLIAVMLVFVVGNMCFHLWNVFPAIQERGLVSVKDQQDKWSAFEKYASSRPNDVFMLSFDRYKEFGVQYISPHKSIRPGAWNNIFSLGYWNINLPPMEQELAKYGITNPMKDILRDNVYVLEADQPVLSYYFGEHYQENIVADTVKKFDDLMLLKYHIEAENEKN